MPSHINYPRCQCEVLGGGVMALNIRDRTNRIRGMIHGGFHAQDKHLHKFHAQFRDNSHHHA